MSVRSSESEKPMKQITSLKSTEDLRQYLQDHRNLNLSLMKDKKDSTLLHVAAFNNDLIKMKLFLQHYKAYCEITHGNKMYETGFEVKVKAWVNAANKEGLTPLHFAALHGNTDIIKLLDNLGANMEYRSAEGENALFMCVQNNQLRALIYFREELTTKLDLNEVNSYGDTILHKAARNGSTSICSYLLTTAVNPNMQNQDGWTPLMEAVEASNKEIVKRLLLKGVDRKIQNRDGNTALEMARKQSKLELVRILQDEFSVGDKIKIACNIKIVYRVEPPSYFHTVVFLVLFNLVFLPTCIITEFTQLPVKDAIYPIIAEGLYYALTMVLFGLLLQKPPKKIPRASLYEVQMPFCAQCRTKIRNQFHCFTCGTCIYRYDHHCPWINNCVGGRNIGKFYAFLWLIQLGTLFVIACHLCMLGVDEKIVKYRDFTTIQEEETIISVLCLVVAIFFGIGIFFLIVEQTKNLMSNTTSFERSKMKRKKANGSKETMLSESDSALNQSMVSNEEEEMNTGCITNCRTMLCSSN